ncbi:Zn-ribbon domain-containing OB-fold protein [Baekduia soli]|uniref:Zn-ribbon domain-containing OB-fold protein n=1 Tax=Baekduia soli TaxID=496014 RepID=UPI001651BED4|nr:OB-fold domain-containing protein [Baekduia soli]
MERSPADVFAEHCRRHELAYQVDREGHPVFRPRVGHDTWRVSAGLGTVYAVTVVRRRGEDPHTLALIDVDEGFRMMSTVVGPAPEDVRVGLRVRLAWREDGEVPVPVFEPADEVAA